MNPHTAPNPTDIRFYRLQAAQKRVREQVEVAEAFTADRLAAVGATKAVGLRRAISDFAFESARAGYLLACEQLGHDRAGALALWERAEWSRSEWTERTAAR